MLRPDMLVKVQLLRQAGERLEAGEVRSRPPYVGWIRLYPGVGGPLGRDERERVAVLQLPEGRLLELYDAQLIQWDGRGLILSGEERVTGLGMRRFERHRQAWWCKPIDVRDVAPAPQAPRTLALDDASETDWIAGLE
jgi:hypothetical protein